MEVLDRAMLKHVAGAGGSAPVQKPVSTTTDASGAQIQRFDLGNGVSAFVTCTGVSGQVSFGISGKKLIQLDAGVGGSYTSCTLTTVGKDGHVIESKKVSEADVDKDDVQIAANGDIGDAGDGGSGDTGADGDDDGDGDGDGDGGGSGEGGGGDSGGGGGGGGGGDDHAPNEEE